MKNLMKFNVCQRVIDIFNRKSSDNVDVNAYLLCMHDDEHADCISDWGVCLNCGEFIGHQKAFILDAPIYIALDNVGDKQYFFIENMPVGTYRIDEDSEGNESIEYSIYDEQGNEISKGLVANVLFEISEEGKYYLAVERVNDLDESPSFGFEIATID